MMGKINIYLSDGLEKRVKAANISVSNVCQTALIDQLDNPKTVAPWERTPFAYFPRNGGAQWDVVAIGKTPSTIPGNVAVRSKPHFICTTDDHDVAAWIVDRLAEQFQKGRRNASSEQVG